MADRRASLMDPRIEQLMAKVDSKFTLVTLSSMRAREINDYYNQLGEGSAGSFRPRSRRCPASRCRSRWKRSRPARSCSSASTRSTTKRGRRRRRRRVDGDAVDPGDTPA